ncbi:MAG: glutamine synthetase [Rhodobacteraceae bacterium]|nr:glutamine synthetase [Paracoccaceae bacterium]
MINEPLIFAAISDLAGKMRGKAFPVSQTDERMARGVGWVPTNALITCFDTIADTPFGSLGDLVLMPDAATSTRLDFDDGTPPEHFVLCDITTPEGAPWLGCTRGILKAALRRFHALTGLLLKSTFEHEFQRKAGDAPPGEAFSLQAFSRHRAFGETIIAAMQQAGLRQDTFLKEYGADQFEVTMKPEVGIKSADSAAIVKEIVHFAAARHGQSVTFTPIQDPAGVGNGVHVHLSFTDAAGNPATHDTNGPYGMALRTGQFVAGILKYLDSIVAITAPSAISYARLTPHRWSAAFNNLGYRDREASVRICPVVGTDPSSVARQYNFEFRAADAAASPHLLLAAIVHAGCQGIEDELPAPEATQEDLSGLSETALAARGLRALPGSLGAALDKLGANETVRGWFPDGFADVYIAHKRGELATAQSYSQPDLHAAYARIY